MNKKRILTVLTVLLVLTPALIYAQDLQGQIDSWRNSLKVIVKSIIGLAALGGGVYAYFKVQSSEGGSGQKAILSFIGALIFGALLFAIIDFFMA